MARIGRKSTLQWIKEDYNSNPLRLRRWVIIDEFENKTSVMLQNIKMDVKLSNKIFIPDFYDEKSD